MVELKRAICVGQTKHCMVVKYRYVCTETGVSMALRTVRGILYRIIQENISKAAQSPFDL